MMPNNREWTKTTCGQAKLLSEQGYVIWWRPDGKLSKTPDKDLAYYR